jgi:signal transduction histidine kinase
MASPRATFSLVARRGKFGVVHEAYDQRQLLLTTLPPSRQQVRWAVGTAAALVVATVITVPFVSVQLSRVDAFLPAFVAGILITALITSTLLFSQFTIARQNALLVLASGYLYIALIVIPYALTFPGLIAPTGLLGAGLQTTAWLYSFWHAGSPLWVIAYALIGERDTKSRTSHRPPAVAIGTGIVAVIAIVVGLTWLTTAGDQLLPRVTYPDRASFNSHISFLIGGSIMTLDALALALLWRRRHSVLNLWLMVMCCAWLVEAMISIVLNAARFDVSWYAGRAFGFIAAFVVLIVLLSEMAALYANLARSIERQRGNRHARQVAMDAMAASIVHEINQPLAAIETSASASLRWLAKTTPELDMAREGLTRIVHAVRRVNEITGSTRSMFKKGAHGQTLLDVNDLVRATLTMIDLDLLTQRVSVTTNLRKGLPQLWGDRGQLQQVFLNLIMNAIEAMSSVTDRSRVLLIRSDLIEGSSDVVVAVEDTGMGIEGESSDHVFEPFFTTKSTGTGVGLTICRVIIEAHGGSLRASANKPYGAIFRVTLPSGDL